MGAASDRQPVIRVPGLVGFVVGLDVVLQRLFLPERSVAVGASEGTFSRVQAQVSLEPPVLAERARAVRAGEGLLPRVDELVALEVRQVREGGGAGGAQVGPRLGVHRLQVAAQAGVVREGLGAQVAGKVLGARVLGLVRLQVLAVLEGGRAQVALVDFVPGVEKQTAVKSLNLMKRGVVMENPW